MQQADLDGRQWGDGRQQGRWWGKGHWERRQRGLQGRLHVGFVLRVHIPYGGFEVIPSPGLGQGISCKGESVPCQAFRIIYRVFDKFCIGRPLVATAQRFYVCYVAGEATGSALKARRILASTERHACCCGHRVGTAGRVAGRTRLPCRKIFAARGATWRDGLRTIKTPRESYECTGAWRATKEPLAVGSS